MAQKPKLALYWAASCGGCEIAVVRLYAKILDVAEAFDIVLWPCIMDFKYKDVEALPEKSIDVCLFNGAIRNSEQEYMAHLLREKSKVLVAYGTCAHTGGIPGLANVANREAIFQRVYHETPSTVNDDGVRPQLRYQVPEGELTLPEFYDTVRTLAQVVPVEYFVPGCPPVKEQTEAVLQAVMEGHLPAPGSVVGASDRTVCYDCTRIREDKRIRGFHRPYEIVADSSRCLLEQGIICAGPATRGGCGAPCPSVNMPCRGCYGPPPNVFDQGGKLLSALASIVDTQDADEIERVANAIPDLLGVCYLFGLPASLLRRVRENQEPFPARMPDELAKEGNMAGTIQRAAP
jgi:F420-non-reducing hydrogenase small subunit